MTSFVFVRHGETEGTKGDIFTGGKTDSPLTKEGLLGTKMFIHKLFNKSDEYFDACLTSRMQRAKAFGYYFKEYFDGPVFHDPRLDEKDAGVFEGCHAPDFHRMGFEEDHIYRWCNGLECGESHYAVALRVVEAIKYWSRYFPEQRVLVGSHTDVIRAIEAPYKRACTEEEGKYLFRRNWHPEYVRKEDPSDEELTKPIPHFYTVEIDSDRFMLED